MAKGIEIVLMPPDDPMFFEGLSIKFDRHWRKRLELLRESDVGLTSEEQEPKARLLKALDEALDGKPSPEE